MSTEYIFFGLVIVVIVLFMFRNGRKRAKDAATLTNTLKPGAEVMTTFGVFGTIESIDLEENRLVLKTGPTSELTIHRQAVGRVVTPVPDDDPTDETHLTAADGAILNGEPISTTDSTVPPAYGERVVESGHAGDTAVPASDDPTIEETPRRAASAKSKRTAE